MYILETKSNTVECKHNLGESAKLNCKLTMNLIYKLVETNFNLLGFKLNN